MTPIVINKPDKIEPASSTLHNMPTTAAKLPNEIFKSIIENGILTGPDLKSVRLVCHAFKDFSTPLLFKEISFSVTRENLRAFTSIAGNQGLNKHVKAIAVDATSSMTVPAMFYTQVAASNCHRWLDPAGRA
jgi:hypothetical protein